MCSCLHEHPKDQHSGRTCCSSIKKDYILNVTMAQKVKEEKMDKIEYIRKWRTETSMHCYKITISHFITLINPSSERLLSRSGMSHHGI